jgi:hypothetical protein
VGDFIQGCAAPMMPSAVDVYQNWSEKYGQIYNLNIIFDDMVRKLLSIHL